MNQTNKKKTQQDKPEVLDNLRIVLVRTKDPKNIGMVARAMTNMGFGRLYLVAPQTEITSESYGCAVGCNEVLENAQIVDSIMDAVEGCGHVVGTTRRVGRRRRASRTLRPLAERWLEMTGNNEVAILFGPEDHGLSTEDLEMCHERVRIPTADVFPSLNLAQAVLLVCYETFLASQGTIPLPKGKKIAPVEEQEMLFADMQDALDRLEFFGARNPEYSMRYIRELFSRGGMSSDDVRLLRGIFTRIIKKVPKEE